MITIYSIEPDGTHIKYKPDTIFDYIILLLEWLLTPFDYCPTVAFRPVRKSNTFDFAKGKRIWRKDG